VRALRPIHKGEELTIDYGAHWEWCPSCDFEHLVPRSPTAGPHVPSRKNQPSPLSSIAHGLSAEVNCA
jgi:hypothetical protein